MMMINSIYYTYYIYIYMVHDTCYTTEPQTSIAWQEPSVMVYIYIYKYIQIYIYIYIYIYSRTLLLNKRTGTPNTKLNARKSI